VTSDDEIELISASVELVSLLAVRVLGYVVRCCCS